MVRFIEINPLYELVFPDFRLKVPKDMDLFSKELIKIAPEEKENIREFFEEIKLLQKITEKLRLTPPYEKYSLILNMLKNPETINFLKYKKVKWDSFINGYFTNEN